MSLFMMLMESDIIFNAHAITEQFMSVFYCALNAPFHEFNVATYVYAHHVVLHM